MALDFVVKTERSDSDLALFDVSRVVTPECF
jgi:hypothetical protein